MGWNDNDTLIAPAPFGVNDEVIIPFRSQQKKIFGNPFSAMAKTWTSGMQKAGGELATPTTTPGQAIGAGARALNQIVGTAVATPIAGIAGLFPQGTQRLNDIAKNFSGEEYGKMMMGNLYRPLEQTGGNLSQFIRTHPNTAIALKDFFPTVGALSMGIGGGKIPAEKIYNAIIKGTEKIVAGTGGAIKNVGISNIISGSKIKDALALKAAPNVMAGAQKIGNDVAKYKLQSTTKGFKGIVPNAQNAIDARMMTGEQKILAEAAKNPTASLNIDEHAMNLMDDVKNGNVAGTWGDENRAQQVVDNIHKTLEQKGLAGIQPIIKIPEIKQALKEGMGLFKKGAYNVQADPLKQNMGENLYFRLMDGLNEQVPGLKEINSEIRDIINVKTMAQQAAKRIGNKDKIGLSDWASLIGVTLLEKEGKIIPGATIPVAGGLVVAGKKILSGGRGSSALISAGQAIESAATKPIRLGDLLKNKTGEITYKNAKSLAENSGLKYNGYQESGIVGKPGIHLFTTPEGNTFAANTIGELKKKTSGSAKP
jgi:hypothetical protein